MIWSFTNDKYHPSSPLPAGRQALEKGDTLLLPFLKGGQVEFYIRDHSEAEFSHGICPDCMKKLYPNL
jgi:hypothetical protein